MIRLTSLVLAITIAGCGSLPTWHKVGASQSDFFMDRGQCNAQAYSVVGMRPEQVGIVFRSCMQGKGWALFSDS